VAWQACTTYAIHVPAHAGAPADKDGAVLNGNMKAPAELAATKSPSLIMLATEKGTPKKATKKATAKKATKKAKKAAKKATATKATKKAKKATKKAKKATKKAKKATKKATANKATNKTKKATNKSTAKTMSPQTGSCPSGYLLKAGILKGYHHCPGTAIKGWCVLSKHKAKSFCDATKDCDGVSETSNKNWFKQGGVTPGMVQAGKIPGAANPEWATCVKVAEAKKHTYR